MSNVGFDLHIEFMGCDSIRVFEEQGRVKWQVKVCGPVLRLLHDAVAKQGRDPRQWKQFPLGNHHEAILVRKLMLQATGLWHSPNRHDEICHCRQVSYAKIEDAVIAGAHTPALVTLWTSASSACGSCRPDVQAVIDYLLKGSTVPGAAT